MKLPRRTFLHMAGAAAALPVMPHIASAQSYPTRPVHLIVSVAAGGSPDIIGRLIAEWLSQQLGQPFIVDNRAGAAGNIGTELAVKASPDGYTLLLALSANAINASLYKDLPYDPVKDFVAITLIARVPNMLVVIPPCRRRT